jgi:UDP-glucose 4-epimerase
MTKILVTGGCGFIGSHLVEALVACGRAPIVLDDLSTGKRTNIPAGIPVIEGSLMVPEILKQAMEGVSAVVHLAAVSSVQKCNENWVESHEVNLSGTIRVFEAARDHGHIPVIYASSAAVYGNVSTVPISEQDLPVPLTAYGVDKYGCELHAGVAGRIHGVPSVGLRFFNAYGPRQDPSSPYSGVISIFIDRMRQGTPVTIFGDGKQQRDFIHVSDVVAHLLAALDKATQSAPVFNVCTGTGTSISDLAQMLLKLSGSGSSLKTGPARSGDIGLSVGNNAAAITGLGVTANVCLKDGLTSLLY